MDQVCNKQMEFKQLIKVVGVERKISMGNLTPQNAKLETVKYRKEDIMGTKRE